MRTLHVDSLLIRERLVKVLRRTRKPLTVPDIMRYMMRFGSVHKTSLYRQLDRLVAEGVVEKVLLDPSVAYYELVRAHHHHMMCVHCHAVTCLHDLDLERVASVAESNVRSLTGAVIKGHNISFDGICINCQ